MRLLTRAEAATALRVSVVSLWGYTKRRELRCVRLGRRRLYDERDLEAFVGRHKSKQGKI